MKDIFEKIASETNKNELYRQCRTMKVPDNIGEIKPGQYCELKVEGGGPYCQWYYYLTLKGQHMLIFRTPKIYNGGFNYSGRIIDSVPESFGITVDKKYTKDEIEVFENFIK